MTGYVYGAARDKHDAPLLRVENRRLRAEIIGLRSQLEETSRRNRVLQTQHEQDRDRIKRLENDATSGARANTRDQNVRVKLKAAQARLGEVVRENHRLHALIDGRPLPVGATADETMEERRARLEEVTREAVTWTDPRHRKGEASEPAA